MKRKKSNGEGTIYKRKDGRWDARAYVTLTDRTRKRVGCTAIEREKVANWLDETKAQEKRNIAVLSCRHMNRGRQIRKLCKLIMEN